MIRVKHAVIKSWLCRSLCFKIFWDASKHLYKRLCLLVRWSVGLSVSPLICWSIDTHITLSAFFSAVCGRIDLEFGGYLHVFQFLFFFFLSSSSNSFFRSFSSKIKLKKNKKPHKWVHIIKGRIIRLERMSSNINGKGREREQETIGQLDNRSVGQ